MTLQEVGSFSQINIF